jgi:predicted acyltransferase
MTITALPKNERLLSLDAFRGLTVAAMILVNNPGDWGHIYPPLEHSKWDGCTPTDLIFPFFLFMVGVSIVYAMESKKQIVASHGQLLLKAFRRAVVILIINYVTHLIFHPSFANIRIPGVLPRIAVVYFVCTFLYVKTSQKTRDWLFAILLIGYYLVMNFVPVPGVGTPNLHPETNIGAWVDRLVFTPDHLWADSKTWDPEGLLGTFPAIATGLFGIRMASWLKRKDREDSVKVSWLFIYGILALVAGMVWNLFFPINKALWTSSFVLYTGGMATLGLTFTYWLVDVQGYKKYIYFFLPFGANAITAYVLSNYVPFFLGMIKINRQNTYQLLFQPFFSPVNASLASAVFLVLLLWVIMQILYVRKIFIKV